MMTTNKLTKTFASGSLAIGVLAGAVLTATSASANMITVDWATFKGGFVLPVGDKKVTYVDIGVADDVIRDNDTVTFMESGNEYQFIFNTLGGGAPFDFAAAFSYKIEITSPLDYFAGVQLNADVNVNAPLGFGNVVKSFAEIPSLTLTSTGGPIPPSGFTAIPGHLKTLTVTDTITPNAGGILYTLSNKYIQETKSVPEPGTILGLLTVGGLGLVSRFKKQK